MSGTVHGQQSLSCQLNIENIEEYQRISETVITVSPVYREYIHISENIKATITSQVVPVLPVRSEYQRILENIGDSNVTLDGM